MHFAGLEIAGCQWPKSGHISETAGQVKNKKCNIDHNCSNYLQFKFFHIFFMLLINMKIKLQTCVKFCSVDRPANRWPNQLGLKVRD
jgi:hypothetical protein